MRKKIKLFWNFVSNISQQKYEAEVLGRACHSVELPDVVVSTRKVILDVHGTISVKCIDMETWVSVFKDTAVINIGSRFLSCGNWSCSNWSCGNWSWSNLSCGNWLGVCFLINIIDLLWNTFVWIAAWHF